MFHTFSQHIRSRPGNICRIITPTNLTKIVIEQIQQMNAEQDLCVIHLDEVESSSVIEDIHCEAADNISTSTSSASQSVGEPAAPNSQQSSVETTTNNPADILDNGYIVALLDNMLVNRIVPTPPQDTNSEIRCCICYEYGNNDIERCTFCGTGYCRPCLERHMINQIQFGAVRQGQLIPCPQLCGRRFSTEEVQQLVPEEMMEKYKQMLLEYEISHDQMRFWCPTADCGTILSIVAHESRVTCSKCKASVCVRCKRSHRRFTPCSTMTDVALRFWQMGGGAVGEGVKSCPSCHSLIEKNEGCRHMTCSCGYQFCWYCRAEWVTSEHKIYCGAMRLWGAKIWGNNLALRTVSRLVGVPVGVGLAVGLGGAGIGLGVVGLCGWGLYYPIHLINQRREQRRQAGIQVQIQTAQYLENGARIFVPFDETSPIWQRFVETPGFIATGNNMLLVRVRLTVGNIVLEIRTMDVLNESPYLELARGTVVLKTPDLIQDIQPSELVSMDLESLIIFHLNSDQLSSFD